MVQETRHFHEDTGTTTSGRSKEEAQDYRYFPEPDLVPMAPAADWIESIRRALPELPAARRRRLAQELGASVNDLEMMGNAGVLDLVADTAAAGAPAAEARNWWLSYLAQKANELGTSPAELPITPAQVARVIALIAEGSLNNKLARTAVDGVLAGEGDPDQVVAARGLAIVNDDSALGVAVDEAIAAQPDIADKVRSGKVAAAGALVGAVMKATRGSADAARVRELILERLGQ